MLAVNERVAAAPRGLLPDMIIHYLSFRQISDAPTWSRVEYLERRSERWPRLTDRWHLDAFRC